jgi:hypothetical protein
MNDELRGPQGMPFETFQQARWLAVYGAFIATQAQAKMDEGSGAPDQADVNRFCEEAAELANMVAIANGDPER